MIIKGIILGGLVVFFGIVSLASLVIYIVQKKNQSTKRIWLIIFIISFATSSVTGIYTLTKVVNKTIDKSNEFKESVIDSLAEVMNDDRTYLVDSSYSNSQIELLKSYELDSLPNKVPASFYTYFGFRDWYRYPLVYPYSMNCVDIRDFGQIYDESSAADITQDDQGVIQLPVYGITKFAFDNHYLIAEISSQFEKEKSAYIIFEFKSQQAKEFKTYSDLVEKVKEIEFQGSHDLMTIKEYDALF